MEISYRRELKHNYLVIEAENSEQSYEVRMMADNTIEGLMKFRVKRVDDKCCYCYEITSRQPLSRLLENKCLKAGEIRLLILGLAKTLERMEEYLLKEEQIFLQPEYIYVEPELFSVEFCLIPGRKSDFPAELCKLLEYLLGKVDYQDKTCVVMTYGMYRESLKENYGIEDLLKFLTGMVNQSGEEASEDQPERLEGLLKTKKSNRSNRPAKLDGRPGTLGPGDLGIPEMERSEMYEIGRLGPGKSEMHETSGSGRPGTGILGESEPERSGMTGTEASGILKSGWFGKSVPFHKETEKRPRKSSWKERLLQKLGGLRENKTEKTKQKSFAPQETELPWQMIFADEPPRPPVPSQTPGDTKSSRAVREYEKTEGPNTVLLYDKEEKQQLRRLISMEPGVSDIVIAYYPFIVGKQENLVDFVMTQETVSRLHLRIDEIDGGYQITDLNSTNGTEVAGKMLENNESAVVSPGDEVMIAGLRFKFG